jgi:putative FmdB family regulatory protein
MPLYEYSCTTCGMTFEVIQRDSRVLTACGDDCPSGDGEGTVVRKLSAHAVLSGGRREVAPAPTCGSCGNAAGSCGMDN